MPSRRGGMCMYCLVGDGLGWIDGDFDVADYPDFTHEELIRLRALRGARMGLDEIANSAADAYFRMVGGMRG